jgi:hypothetical protein
MSAQKAEVPSMTFNILVKRVERMYIAHCLELDIVATSNDPDQVEKDIISLIDAQIDYAFSHDNIDYLFRPAPIEVWKEFFKCKDQIEKRNKIESQFKNDFPESVVPPWMIAKICKAFKDHVKETV